MQVADSLRASSATEADIYIPAPPGLEYLPFQKAGIAFANARTNTLIGDEMGLGKTIQAIGLVNLNPDIRRVLVICPASLRLNWAREFKKWDVGGRSIGAVIGSSLRKATARQYVAEGIRLGSGWLDTDVVIINYDIIGRYLERIHNTQWDLLVVDEAHYLKNWKARRTANILGRAHKDETKRKLPIAAGRRLFLTGTPIQNRPIELWSLANALDPGLFPRFMEYALRYCAARQKHLGKRKFWDFTGSSNLEELGRMIRESFFIRRLKKDVLTELPPKVRQIVALPSDDLWGLVQREREMYDSSSEDVERIKEELVNLPEDSEQYTVAVRQLREAEAVLFTEMSLVRHEVGIEKAPLAVDHIKGILAQVDKLVVFAHHKDVVECLVSGLAGYGVVSITGSTPISERQAAVDAFQNDNQTRVFVGNIMAAGTGITLTAASVVVFVELDWVPGIMSQAEDRLHRISQQETVLVQYIVLDGSLDARLANTLIEKQAVLDRILDPPERMEVVTVPEIARFPPVGPRKFVPLGLMATSIEAADLALMLLMAQRKGLKYPKIRFPQDVNGHDLPEPLVLRLTSQGDVYLTGKGKFEERTVYAKFSAYGDVKRYNAWTPEIELFVRELVANPVEFTATAGRQTGNCVFCTKPLTDERSVVAGYGPTCAGRYGLPWGEAS